MDKNELLKLTDLPDKCPVTGLKIKTDKSWEYISDSYVIKVGLLAESIIIPKEAGISTKETTSVYCSIIDKVVADFELHKKQFIVIEDYTLLSVLSTQDKDYFVNFYVNKQPALVGMYFLGLSKLLKISINIINKLPIVKADTISLNTYQEAILKASKKLNLDISESVIEDTDIGNAKVTYNVLNYNTLYISINGFLSEAVVEDAGIKLEQAFRLINAKNGHYRIIDYSNLKGGTYSARNKYMALLQRLNKIYPLNLYVAINPPKNIKAIINISKNLVKFPIDYADDFEQAVSIIKTKKRKSTKLKFSKRNIKKYINEIIDALVDYSQLNNYSSKTEISEENPFSDVFKTFGFMKTDIDLLMTENIELENKLITIKKTRDYNQRIINYFTRRVEFNLRTSLNSISGISSLLSDKNIENKDEYLSKIETNTNLANVSVNNLSELNKQERPKSEINLNTLIHSIVKDIEDYNFKNITIVADKNNNANAVILLEKSKVKQIIKNLIVHYITNLTNQEARITISYFDEEGTNSLTIGVLCKDYCANQESLYNIFESNFEDLSIYDSHFCLAIAKWFVTELNGDIWGVSTKEEGTKLYFSIPKSS